MNWIGKSKKEMSAEQKISRAKIILTALGVMILIVLLKPVRNDNENKEPDTLTAMMDQTVDSLIHTLGFQDYNIYYKGEIEKLYQQLDCPEEDEIVRLELRRDLVEKAPDLTDKEKIKKIEEIQNNIEALENQVERFYANPKTHMKYYSRRIRFETPDNRKYTFFQQMMENMFRIKYFKEMTGMTDNPEEELKKINKEIE